MFTARVSQEMPLAYRLCIEASILAERVTILENYCFFFFFPLKIFADV